jgi:hypothetical protein
LELPAVKLKAPCPPAAAYDGLAWQQFEKTVKEEGLAAFFTKVEKQNLFH